MQTPLRPVPLRVLYLLPIVVTTACRPEGGLVHLSGPYLGQDPPGLSPKVFAPGVVSTGANELNAAFSPDGREFYFSQWEGGRNTLMRMRTEDGLWTDRSVAPFSGTFSDVDPFLSADGRRLYFSSSRPIHETGEEKDSDLWYVERGPSGGWGDPMRLGSPNALGPDDYYTSISLDGTLYFSRFQSHGAGGDLYSSRFIDGDYAPPLLLEAPLSTDASEHDPLISLDGEYLIFASDRVGGYGEADLYISFATSQGDWTDPVNMGPVINSPGYDFCPMLSPDGRYLFFTRNRGGNGDIYWVDAKVIEAFRPGA